jgi:hypothetical protein
VISPQPGCFQHLSIPPRTGAVETHDLQGSEGQLRKPTKLFGVGVIATPFRKDNEVNARSDDLLALQAVEGQLEDNTSGLDVAPSLNLHPEISISESRTFTNCWFDVRLLLHVFRRDVGKWLRLITS